MAELRVDPTTAGARIAAALHAAAQALASPAAIAPPLPPGADPVSVAAAGRMTANAATLSTHLASGIPRIAAGVEAVSAALSGYETADAEGAALVSGHGAGAVAGGLPAARMLPAVPAIEVPDMPLDGVSALATLPGDPAVIDDALHAGAAEAGLHAHAEAWDTAAQQLHTAAGGLRSLSGGMDGSWSGDAADGLTDRLDRFGDWMVATAGAAQAHAQSARQAAQFYRSAVNAHPRAAEVRQTQQTLLAAVRRASAGDPTAVGQAMAAEAKLAALKEQSVTAMTDYGSGVGGISGGEHPGESPSLGQAGGSSGHKGGDGAGEGRDGDGVDGTGDGTDGADEFSDGADGDLAAGEGLDGLDPQAGVVGAEGPGQLGGAGQQLQQLMGPMMQMPTQLASSAGQALSAPAQQIGQIGQQASQMFGQAMGSPGGLGRTVAGLGAGDIGGAGADLGSLGDLGGAGGGGGGLGDLGDLGGLGGMGGGGADFGGGTVPAALPPPPAAAPPPAAQGAVSVPRTSVPVTGGMAGGMPMGMMPMAGRGAGGEGDKEIQRNTEWFPDEPLVKDEAAVVEAVAGQRRRPRPQET